MICHEARDYAPGGRTGLLTWLSAQGVDRAGRASTPVRLVRHLRDRGAMLGVVGRGRRRTSASALLEAEPPMAGRLLAAEVSGEIQGEQVGRRPGPASWSSTTAPRPRSCACSRTPEPRSRSCPHDATADEVLALAPDGVLLANGPGDPGSMDAHVARCARMLDDGRPRLRHLPRPPAAGSRARRSRRSSCRSATAAPTTPCSRAGPAAVLVTSQNHGFALRPPAAGRRHDRGHAHLALRRHRRGAAADRAARLERAVPSRGLARGRTTHASSLTSSSRPARTRARRAGFRANAAA